MRQAHPRHRYRRRQAVGPTGMLLGVMALGLVVAANPGWGPEPTNSGLAIAHPAMAAATEPSARPSNGTSATPGLSDPDARIGAAGLTAAALGPPTLGSDVAGAADPHRRIALADVDASAVAHLGRGLKVVVLGDSYASGWSGAGIGGRGWPALVARGRGWRIVNLSVPGTGFLNPGWTGQPIGSRVDAAVRQNPQVVLVAGGHNDSRWTATATSRAAVRAIDRLHAALPDAVIVIIAPIWQNGSPPARCLILRDALRRESHAIGAVFIDPLAEHWFAGSSHRYIGADGLHPTNAGHAWLASRILADLAGI